MKRFENFIYGVLDSKPKKIAVIAATLAVFFGSLMMLPGKAVLAKMLPGKSANTFSVYVDTPKGSSASQTKKVSRCVAQLVAQEREVTDVSIFVGEGAALDYAGLVKGSAQKNAENKAEIVVNLTDKHDREEKSFEMVHRLRPSVKSSCEALVEGSTVKMIEQPAGPPTLAAIVIELYGPGGTQKRELAEKLARILNDTPNLVDVDISHEKIYTQYDLVIDKDKLRRSGLSVAQVNKILYLAFEGSAVGVKNSKDHASQLPLFLMLDAQAATLNQPSLEQLRQLLMNLKLMNAQGKSVALGEVVSITAVEAVPEIQTKNLKEVTRVTAQADMTSQVYPLLEARSAIKQELAGTYKVSNADVLNLRLEAKESGEVYSLVWDGEMDVTLDTFADLGLAFIAALALIFVVLVVYYKSYSIASVVLLGSFLSLFGVIIGHWLMDIFTQNTFYLTATSMIGFIVLMGISSRNSMLLIDFVRILMEKKDLPKKRAIAIATATRAKPIFLTAGTVALASILLTADPIFGGLGAALIFGTLAGVLVSLIFIPVMLDWLQDVCVDSEKI
ncbi:MAG: efflux RND transporter permease subunit [Campylobacterota bacterium]